MKLNPIGDRFVLKCATEEKTKGGIILSYSPKAHSNICEVVSIGEDALGIEDGHPVCIRPGDKVIIGKYVGTEVTLDGEELLMVHASEILAVLEP